MTNLSPADGSGRHYTSILNPISATAYRCRAAIAFLQVQSGVVHFRYGFCEAWKSVSPDHRLGAIPLISTLSAMARERSPDVSAFASRTECICETMPKRVEDRAIDALLTNVPSEPLGPRRNVGLSDYPSL
jgi:hypothetical protein